MFVKQSLGFAGSVIICVDTTVAWLIHVRRWYNLIPSNLTKNINKSRNIGSTLKKEKNNRLFNTQGYVLSGLYTKAHS